MSRLRALASMTAALWLAGLPVTMASAAPSTPVASSIGFQTLRIPDPQGPLVEIGIWYPADRAPAPRAIEPFVATVASDAPVLGDRLPLVVFSHGNGGSFASHLDTAMALAKAGFVVAALTHTGDNYRDQSRAVDMPNRPRQLKLLVDYMLATWPQHAQLDATAIGAFGFSSGGFTVLAAAGGEPDLTTMLSHCRAHPTYFDCQLSAKVPQAPTAPPIWIHDSRLKAVVSAAPALGFAFGRAGLSGVTAPVQLWRAADDHVLPNPDYAEAVLASLPTAPEYHVVSGADHFDFLAPCSNILQASAPTICSSKPGFDRTLFHEAFNREIVAFFRARLSN